MSGRRFHAPSSTIIAGRPDTVVMAGSTRQERRAQATLARRKKKAATLPNGKAASDE